MIVDVFASIGPKVALHRGPCRRWRSVPSEGKVTDVDSRSESLLL